MSFEAIILSAGEGSRLGLNIPKCLVKVGGKTLLQRQLELLTHYGVKNFVLTLQKKHVVGHFVLKGSHIAISKEEQPCGTAGGVRKALKYIKGNEFFVIYCDDITDIDLERMRELGAPCIACKDVAYPYGILTLGKWTDASHDFHQAIEQHDVILFHQKPVSTVFIGVSLLSKDIEFPEEGMLETDVFPKLIEQRKLKAYKHNGFWRTVNTEQDIREWSNG